jgi:uncharacterized protein (TIGR00369 family)
MGDSVPDRIAEQKQFIREFTREEEDLLRWIGAEIETVEHGRVVVSTPASSKVINSSGSIHGGIIATLGDHASGMALLTTFDLEPEEALAAIQGTIELDVTYVRPARSTLYAEGTVVRAGSSIGVVDLTFECSTETDREEVATGKALFRIHQ